MEFSCPSHTPARPVAHAPSLSSDDLGSERSLEEVLAAAEIEEPLDMS
jgi:hypothetical protein